MKRIITVASLLATVIGIAGPAQADVYVDSYYRSNGTYVEPYYRSSPNSSVYDNYSTDGNYNPYTGRSGYRNPSSNYSYPTYPEPTYSSPYYSPYYYGY